jgi:hypothetical protein
MPLPARVVGAPGGRTSRQPHEHYAKTILRNKIEDIRESPVRVRIHRTVLILVSFDLSPELAKVSVNLAMIREWRALWRAHPNSESSGRVADDTSDCA